MGAIILTGLFMVTTVQDAGAVTIYSYLDDQGNPVYTDAPETIPPKYRARVKTHERAEPAGNRPSVLQSVRQTLQEQTKQLGFSLPSFKMDGVTPHQSGILTYAGAAAIGLLLVMYLSKSQLLKMLAFCLLVVLGIGVPVLMYVSDGGPMDAMKQKAKATGQAQEERLQQIPR